MKWAKSLINRIVSRKEAPPTFDDDVFIVSYPKSGNTWIRFLIANMLREEDDEPINFQNVDQYSPEWQKPDDGRKIAEPSGYYMTHSAYTGLFPKVVYIVRDPRDVYVSYYHFKKPKLEENCSFLEFIENFNSPFGRWSNHVTSWLDKKSGDRTHFHMLRYEDVLEDPISRLSELCSFLEIPATDEKMEQSVRDSSFDKMKKIEQTYGLTPDGKSKVTFVRSGKGGAWKEYFGPAEWAAFCRVEDPSVMERLGY